MATGRHVKFCCCREDGEYKFCMQCPVHLAKHISLAICRRHQAQFQHIRRHGNTGSEYIEDVRFRKYNGSPHVFYAFDAEFNTVFIFRDAIESGWYAMFGPDMEKRQSPRYFTKSDLVNYLRNQGVTFREDVQLKYRLDPEATT